MDGMNISTNITTSESSTSDLLNRLAIVVCSFSFLVGLPTHSYVFWLIITGTGSGVALEFFRLNLSVCEIGNCLGSLFISLSIWFSSLSLVKQFVLGLAITGRSLFQSLICVERYLAVVHPVTFLKSKPLRYRLICCSVVWIITLGSCFFSLFVLGRFHDTKTYSWFFPLQFLFFLLIQMFFLVAVLRALKQSGPGDRKKEMENHMKTKAYYLILVTTINTAVLYVPDVVIAFLDVLTPYNVQELWFIALLSHVLAGFVQPVFYLQRTGKLSCLSC